MSKRIKYTDEPLNMGEIVTDNLPPPAELVMRRKTVKVTLELTADSLETFKRLAKRQSVPYQRMLRGLVDSYVSNHAAT